MPVINLLKKKQSFYILLSAAMLLIYFPFGAAYFPYLDDYNAYGAFYHLLRGGESAWSLYTRYGMYTSRPLAGLMDAFVIAPMWNHLWIVLLAMVLLRCLIMPLLDAVFERCGLPWGRAASLVFALYPLLTEGAYWINASVRVVTGFFFLALSAHLLTRYLSRPGAALWEIILAAVCAVLSAGFYEQTVSFGAVMFLIILWSHRKPGAENRRALFSCWLLWPVLYVGFIGAYYAVFIRAGRMAERAVLTNSPLTRVFGTFNAIVKLFVNEQGYALYSLAQKELTRIIASPAGYAAPLLLGLVLAGALAFSLYAAPEDTPTDTPRWGKHGLYTAVCMAMLLLAAFGPFFILQSSFMTLRNIFFAVPVIGMAVALIWDTGVRNRVVKRTLAITAGIIIWVCILLNTGAVNAFRSNAASDYAIAEHILTTLHEGRAPEDYRKVWLFGARYQYAPHGGVNMQSSTLSDWALTGLVNTLAREQYGEIYREANGYYMNPVVPGWAYTLDIAENDLLLAVDADTRVRVLTLSSDTLYDEETGVAYGFIEQTEDARVIRLY